MKQSIIYALDFDGVICDSALETGVSAWKAAAQIWDDFSTPLPPKKLSEQFRQIRPIMGTGYEAILIVRMLNNAETVADIMADYDNKKQQIIEDANLDIDTLKKLFGETRDRWINDNITEWVQMNPLFSGVAEKLQRLSEQGLWYIVTTKQERFVKQILRANQIQLPEQCIFGLDRNNSKEAILLDLVNQHKEQTIYFVEDMLPTLLKVSNNSQLADVTLFLASWGYNTEDDRERVNNYDIKLINVETFLD